MPGSVRRGVSAVSDVEPMLVTAWEDFVVVGGILFASFQSGPTRYTVAMGPAMAFKAIAKARKAMRCGVVERLLGGEPPAH